MSGINDIANTIVLAAAANVVGGTGVAGRQRGCLMGRTGAGVYTCTLDSETTVLANECLVTVCLGATDNRIVRAAVTAANVITITTEDVAGAAADADLQTVKVERLL